jgi:predicted TIM-barrel enzyme
MDSQRIIYSVFGVPRALVGVIHVFALPGTPGSRLDVGEIAEAAAAEARIYEAAGFHGLIIENTHDRPYLKGSVGPEIVAAMTIVGVEVRRAANLPLGVQVLAGANAAAMAVAHACGAAFVRVEGFVFAHVADEGLIESTAGNYYGTEGQLERNAYEYSPTSRRNIPHTPSRRTLTLRRRRKRRSSSRPTG